MTADTHGRRRRLISAALAGALVAAVLGFTPAAAPAQTITIKMATLVPENSSWFLVLKDVADKWAKISGGKVKVILYPGGRRGDDPDVVRDMRLGGLQGAVLTSVGLAEIDKTVFALSIPMAYDSYEEVYAVLEKMRPRLEASMEARGFVVVNWADGGWMHFFTKSPVTTPDDLKKLKFFQWAGDAKSLEIWKAAGFNPRPAPSTELVTGLQTGLFEAFAAPPQVCVIARYYEHARYMTDMNWGLMMAATVIDKGTWARIPADLKPALLQAARDSGAKLQAEIRRSGERDVEAMKNSPSKLVVVPVDAKTKELWRKLAESTYPRIRGDLLSADAFDEAIRYRDEYRKAHPAQPVKK
ncbi:MAG: TRAP transporter substrate-binding protein DctP [Acidobacteria bacterium]|nr:TRAP transporter substrate-binding protein DctP [Acidobacteriota bacterium]